MSNIDRIERDRVSTPRSQGFSEDSTSPKLEDLATRIARLLKQWTPGDSKSLRPPIQEIRREAAAAKDALADPRKKRTNAQMIARIDGIIRAIDQYEKRVEETSDAIKNKQTEAPVKQLSRWEQVNRPMMKSQEPDIVGDAKRYETAVEQSLQTTLSGFTPKMSLIDKIFALLHRLLDFLDSNQYDKQYDKDAKLPNQIAIYLNEANEFLLSVTESASITPAQTQEINRLIERFEKHQQNISKDSPTYTAISATIQRLKQLKSQKQTIPLPVDQKIPIDQERVEFLRLLGSEGVAAARKLYVLMYDKMPLDVSEERLSRLMSDFSEGKLNIPDFAQKRDLLAKLEQDRFFEGSLDDQIRRTEQTLRTCTTRRDKIQVEMRLQKAANEKKAKIKRLTDDLPAQTPNERNQTAEDIANLRAVIEGLEKKVSSNLTILQEEYKSLHNQIYTDSTSLNHAYNQRSLLRMLKNC